MQYRYWFSKLQRFPQPLTCYIPLMFSVVLKRSLRAVWQVCLSFCRSFKYQTEFYQDWLGVLSGSSVCRCSIGIFHATTLWNAAYITSIRQAFKPFTQWNQNNSRCYRLGFYVLHSGFDLLVYIGLPITNQLKFVGIYLCARLISEHILGPQFYGKKKIVLSLWICVLFGFMPLLRKQHI